MLKLKDLSPEYIEALRVMPKEQYEAELRATMAERDAVPDPVEAVEPAGFVCPKCGRVSSANLINGQKRSYCPNYKCLGVAWHDASTRWFDDRRRDSLRQDAPVRFGELTPSQVNDVRRASATGKGCKVLARELGIPHYTIAKITSGRTYQWVPNDLESTKEN